MKFTPLPTDGRVIDGCWFPSTWPMWLARSANLPIGSLAPHMARLLQVIPEHYSPVVTFSGSAAVQTRQVRSWGNLTRPGGVESAYRGRRAVSPESLWTGESAGTPADRVMQNKLGRNRAADSERGPERIRQSLTTLWFWTFTLGTGGVVAWMIKKGLTI